MTYCFANISASKTRIFMKYYLVVNYYLVSLSLELHEYPIPNVRALAIKGWPQNEKVHLPGNKLFSLASTTESSSPSIITSWPRIDMQRTLFFSLTTYSFKALSKICAPVLVFILSKWLLHNIHNCSVYYICLRIIKLRRTSIMIKHRKVKVLACALCSAFRV